MSILVTGGAGFIGANFVLDWFSTTGEEVVVLDALTYAGNLDNLDAVSQQPGYTFVHGDITDEELLRRVLRTYKPRAVINFAAESHVDRSIHKPDTFIRTNVVGTFQLLEAARAYWSDLAAAERGGFRFLHVSTDEVYGSLAKGEPAFVEDNKNQPSSPYAASKAASDHLARAYHHTYGLPVLTTNCSNNYGPFQFPEKLIPLVIVSALAGRPLPVYGDGQQIRDWLYVGDHCSAIRRVLSHGRVGETYNVGGCSEKANLEVVHILCDLLDELRPSRSGLSYRSQILHVKDRLGHDRRYAINATKMQRELDWSPSESFESGLRKTVTWYLSNEPWLQRVQSGAYREWLSKQYETSI